MKTKKIVLTGVLASALLLGACKAKREAIGDEQLEKGQLKNALMMYGKHLDKGGSLSDEFWDNYSLAMIRMMAKVAKDSPEGDVVNTYMTELPKKLEQTKKPETAKEFVEAAITVAKSLIATEDYRLEVNAWKYLNSAKKIAEEKGAGKAEITSALKQLEEAYAARYLKLAADVPDNQGEAAEYYLLAALVNIPGNEAITKQLQEVRKKNISTFLIWAEEVNGITPSPLVDVTQYHIAFRKGTYSQSATSLNGAVQIWNTSGNSTNLVGENFTLHGKDGSVIKNSKKISKDCERFDSEKDCSTTVSFKYPSSFEIDYIQLKNADGQGKKYLVF
jgi:hypothetical protein